MKHTIETFIHDHRQEMDTADPHTELWPGIAAVLDDAQAQHGLERFIRQHRTALDAAVPPSDVWPRVVEHLPAAKSTARRMALPQLLLRVAASVALLLTGAGAGLWYAGTQQPAIMMMADVSPEYAELEQYYKRDIEGKAQQLGHFTGSVTVEIQSDLKDLDNTMTELRRELANVPLSKRKQVVNAMIEQYKAKLNILERVLARLSPEPQYKKAQDDEMQNL